MGKTCLAMFYLNRKVQDTTQTTIAFDVKTKDIIIDGVPSTVSWCVRVCMFKIVMTRYIVPDVCIVN